MTECLSCCPIGRPVGCPNLPFWFDIKSYPLAVPFLLTDDVEWNGRVWIDSKSNLKIPFTHDDSYLTWKTTGKVCPYYRDTYCKDEYPLEYPLLNTEKYSWDGETWIFHESGLRMKWSQNDARNLWAVTGSIVPDTQINVIFKKL